jgi:hypothetical protein
LGRPEGAKNKKTLERLGELRSRLAAGMSESDIRTVMGLSPNQWANLVQIHYESSTPENNAQFMFRFAARQADRYRTVAAVLPSITGKRHARAGLVDPETGRKFPLWAERPQSSKVCQVVKTLAELDNQSLNVGVKLGVYQEAPRRVQVNGEVQVQAQSPEALAARVFDLLQEGGFEPGKFLEAPDEIEAEFEDVEGVEGAEDV